jgi:hypothetical protein
MYADMTHTNEINAYEMHASEVHGHETPAHQMHARNTIMLLHKDAPVNVQGGRYGNALQAASYQCCKRIVELLLMSDGIGIVQLLHPAWRLRVAGDGATMSDVGRE